VVLAATALLLVFLHRLNPEERQLLDRAPEAALAAGCSAVEVVPPYPNGLDQAHVGSDRVPAMPPVDRYRSVPPVSGPHTGSTVAAGDYDSPPPLDAALHSLEHGAVIVWYDPAATDQPELMRLQNFFSTSDEGTHVIVAPYDYPELGDAGRLQEGTEMSLAAWHHLQQCERASLPVAFSFVEAYRFNLYRWGAYRGDAPERFAPI
jgi:hypothetical protein